MSRKLRIGILGASKIAPVSIIQPARTLDEVGVVCVAARDHARARAFADEHGIPAAAESYAALLAREDVDLVHVSLPPAAHAEWSIQALRAGKAVLCEKPFSLSSAEARAMVAESERTSLPLIEAFHYRHHPLMHRLIALVGEGRLGPLQHMRANFDVPIPYRAEEFRWKREQGGGSLMDLGCYAVHALRTLSGQHPAVMAAAMTMQHGVDARTEAQLSFGGKLTGSVSSSMIADRFSANLVLEGEDCTIEVRNFVAPQLGSTFRITRDGKSLEENFGAPSTFAAQLQHLVDVMLHGAPTLTGGADSIANMEAIEAIRAVGYAATGGTPPSAPFKGVR